MMSTPSLRRFSISAFPTTRADRHLTLMLALTFVTGLVDAGGYLGLDRVFVGNMTGNVVILGMGAAGADGLPILGPVLALIAFIAGAGIAGAVLRSASAGWQTPISGVLGCSVVLVIATAVLIGFHPHATPAQIVAATMTAAAMGMQAAAARKVGVADVTTVVVTSTITIWAVEMFAKPSRATILNRRIAAIVVILCGAAVGALLQQIALWSVFAVAAGIGALVVVIGHRH